MRISKDLIRQAVARGWCYPDTQHKDMDADLAEAITKEIDALLSTYTENKGRFVFMGTTSMDKGALILDTVTGETFYGDGVSK